MAYLRIILSRPFIVSIDGRRLRYPRLWYTWTCIKHLFVPVEPVEDITWLK